MQFSLQSRRLDSTANDGVPTSASRRSAQRKLPVAGLQFRLYGFKTELFNLPAQLLSLSLSLCRVLLLSIFCPSLCLWWMRAANWFQENAHKTRRRRKLKFYLRELDGDCSSKACWLQTWAKRQSVESSASKTRRTCSPKITQGEAIASRVPFPFFTKDTWKAVFTSRLWWIWSEFSFQMLARSVLWNLTSSEVRNKNTIFCGCKDMQVPRFHMPANGGLFILPVPSRFGQITIVF